MISNKDFERLALRWLIAKGSFDKVGCTVVACNSERYRYENGTYCGFVGMNFLLFKL